MPLLVQSDQALLKMTKALASEPLIAIDTESNSLYAYREQVCLIQISTRKHDYIIDPFLITDMQPLAPLFASLLIEKVFHAAEYDLLCMKRDYGFTFENLFDTMISARICGIKGIGLGNLLGEFFGLVVDKSHQTDDWGSRPIPAASLLYAQSDTHYLPALRDKLAERLTELDRWHEAREAFYDVSGVQPARNGFNPDGFWRIATPNKLTRRETTVLRELYLLRESLAESRNLPPYKIMNDKTLIAIAREVPLTLTALRSISGVGDSTMRRAGEAIIEAVERGMAAKLQPIPKPEPPGDPLVVERYTALREWRRDRANARGVESDVIIPKEVLWALAEHAPKTLDAMRALNVRGFGDWRFEQYAEDMLGVLKKGK